MKIEQHKEAVFEDVWHRNTAAGRWYGFGRYYAMFPQPFIHDVVMNLTKTGGNCSRSLLWQRQRTIRCHRSGQICPRNRCEIPWHGYLPRRNFSPLRTPNKSQLDCSKSPGRAVQVIDGATVGSKLWHGLLEYEHF